MKCTICKTKFKPIFSTLEKCCQQTECRVKYSMQVVAKQKAKVLNDAKKEWEVKKRVLKDNTTNWKVKLQDEVCKIARLIDKDLLCLARNKGGQIHGGHIYSRGSNQSIRYNLHNIHRQNAQSNHFQNDDGLLREGLINEYGQNYMDFISQLRRTPELRYDTLEFKERYLKARKIVLRLSKLNLTYTINERIAIRNKINLELDIYDKEYCFYLD